MYKYDQNVKFYLLACENSAHPLFKVLLTWYTILCGFLPIQREGTLCVTEQRVTIGMSDMGKYRISLLFRLCVHMCA